MKYAVRLCAGAVLFYGFAPSLMAAEAKQLPTNQQVGRAADVASSAYSYRADRPAEANPPESWVLLAQYAELPFEKPVDVDLPVVRKVLGGLLWEEVRPVRHVELSWPAEAKNRPEPDQLVVSYFDGADQNPHTWWNPAVIKEAGEPEVAADGRTYVYAIPDDTWGVVIRVRGKQDASMFAVPKIRALVDDLWKKLDVEIEWGYDGITQDLSYDGRVEVYDGILENVKPLSDDTGTVMTGPNAWNSAGNGGMRRGVQMSLLYIGSSRWLSVHPDRAQREDVARSIVTLWTKSGSFSFRASDLEQGPILAPDFGFFVRATSKPANGTVTEAPFAMASASTSAKGFQQELKDKGLTTIRQRVRQHAEQSWEGAVAAMHPNQDLPRHPTPPLAPAMQVQVPDERMNAQWQLGAWHILRRSKQDKNGKWSFNDYPFGILAGETAGILRALDFQGMHQEAADGLDQWLSLPMEPQASPGSQGLPDRPLGHFSDGRGSFTHAIGPEGVGGHMDGIHPLGPGMIMHAMHEHFLLTGDMEWLEAHAPRMKANAEWILRQRHLFADNFPGGERLWCKGLQPAMCGTTDANVMYTQFYLMEAYYYQAVKQMAELLTLVDPEEGAKMQIEAAAYRKDILAALDRSIALTPVVPVRDGTYRSFIPLSPYARGLCASAWGWNRCQGHTGALYWDAGLVTTPLINPSGLLSIDDRRVQGFLDVLEDRLLLENPKVHQRTAGFDAEKDWFSHAGWQYQCGFERTPEVYLQADDIPNFLRSMFNQYAVDIQLGEYTFREHTVAGPPDKIFEESAFLDRFRHMLVMEDGETLWLARATRAWLKHGKKVGVKNAPSHFGQVSYEIISDLDNGRICATVDMPLRRSPETVFLRFRHPLSAPIGSVSVNGEDWTAFDADKEVIRLKGLHGKVTVVANYDCAAAVPAMLASVAEQTDGDVRSGNDRIEARFKQLDNSLLGERLANSATGFNWLVPKAPAGAYLTLDGEKLAGFDGTLDFTFSKESVRDTEHGGEEQLLEWSRPDGLALGWLLRSFSGVSVVECKARLRNDSTAVIPGITEFGPLSLRLRGDQGRLKVHWVTRNAYKRHEILLKDLFSVSGGAWNAPDASGWIAIENLNKHEILFVGVEWESGWRLTLRREGTVVLLDCTLEKFSRDLAAGAEMESPRVFLGVSHGELDDSLRDLHDYLRQYVIPPLLPDYPWVTYNIWGTAGDGSDEKAVLAEIPFAAALGVEVFYVDASWYDDSCKDGTGNWFAGLGNWHQEDRDKYPNGLANISKAVHQAGMKFGLWFGPQMVDSRLVGGRIPEAWVAKRDGKNLITGGMTPITQICLGNPEVVEFLKNSIASAVERYDLDWVKWDGSGLPGTVCNCPDHGHQEGDGALAAIQGEYQIWQYLHGRFPDLVLEQCGYGSRLDYGLARYMRTNWLDDSSGDSTPVRKRLINGTYVYPSPYLETWIYKGKETDDEKDPDILNATIRSRMMGLFGFGCLINDPHGVERLSLCPPEAIAAVKRNIADYKKFRHLLHEDVYHFPTAAGERQVGDAIQFCKRDGSESVLMVFHQGRAYSNPNPEPFDDGALEDVVHQANITASSGDSQWGFVPEGTANGAGLYAETGATHGADLRDMWLGSGTGGATNPHPGTTPGPNWIAYEFDKAYPLGKTWIWNWNNEGPTGAMTGLNRVTVEYSETGGSDPNEWTTLGEYNFSKASGTPEESGFEGPDFGGALAKYVVITPRPFTGENANSGNWGAGDCGLSEIRFYQATDRANSAVAAAKAASVNLPPALERTIVPRGLVADATYTTTSLNSGKTARATGAQLMDEGVIISFAKPGMSEILLIKRD